MRSQLQLQESPPPELPDFITQHIDPFSGDDDTADVDPRTGTVMSSRPLNIPRPGLPDPSTGIDPNVVEAPVSRNAPCPCGSGLKFKHCHGQLA